MYRLDQKGTNAHHGIIGYVKKNVNVVDVRYYPGTITEAISITINTKTENVNITGLYIAPQTHHDDIENILGKIQAQHNATYVTVMGHFNIDAQNSTNKKFIKNVEKKYKLFQIMSNFTTKYLTTIYLIFSNCMHQETTSIPTHWSDHYILATTIEATKKKGYMKCFLSPMF